uniref:Uncharacterized protein n=1 Tax=Parascaris equorum TaxID=6256 RepID=A0A914R9T5_PAREQ
MAARTSVTVPVSREPFSIEDHSLHFKIERYWAAGMIPLFPSAYFIHTPAMDAVLTVAIVLHYGCITSLFIALCLTTVAVSKNIDHV